MAVGIFMNRQSFVCKESAMSTTISHGIYNSALFKKAYWQSLRTHIDQVVKYQAVVGLLGKSETGKSTLCHALLGRDVDQQDTIDLNTTSPQEFTLAYKNGKGLALIDMPGFGTTRDRDQAAHDFYISILPEIDLVVWVVKTNDEHWQADLAFYQRTVAAYCQQRHLPVLLVLNEFDQKVSHNHAEQQKYLSLSFSDSSAACSVSALTGRGVYHLLEYILAYLPQQRCRC
ncbi:GTPase [Chitinibacter sp. S2-10]|uniref:GTPase n=1 Tax=Chitinibacter sp. S2-10 TaxID=3373597 RepID=UPI00397756A8